MYRKIIGLLFVCALIVTAGCTQQEENEMNMGLPTALIEVELQLPEAAELGENVIIPALVSLEDEPVVDADEVVFEIWRQGDSENSIRHEAVHQGEGVYVIKHSFNENGIFYVTSHVTVKEMHRMPRKPIAIGEVTEEELNLEEEHSGSMLNHDHMEESHTDEHSHDAGNHH